MTRGASGVLVAVPRTAWAPSGAVVGAAVPAAERLRGFLAQRFPGAELELIAPGPGRPVTRDAVLGALAAARPTPGELFVVLFFGHGIPANDEHPYQSWALTHEEITDADLAQHLGALPAGVDTVVISDCCYGRGFHHVGPRQINLRARGSTRIRAAGTPAPAPPMLRRLSRGFAVRLQEVADAPMVCISAAGNGVDTEGAVLNAVSAQLVSEVTAAAERGASYSALDRHFRAHRFPGREFYVDARPAERLKQIVLGT